MSKVELILTITNIVSLVTIIAVYIKYKTLQYSSKIKIHKCIYNENPNCYEKACGHCNSFKECNICCGGSCDMCPGHKVEYLDREEGKING